MRLTISILLVLIWVKSLSQTSIDTISYSNGCFEVTEKNANKIKSTLYNKTSQLLKISEGKLKGNPKSEWCCFYHFHKVVRFDSNGNKLNEFQDTLYNPENNNIFEFGGYKNYEKEGLWSVFYNSGELWKTELYKQGEFIKTVNEFYDNRVKQYQYDTIETNKSWYVFNNDSFNLELINITYPFKKIIIYRKWDYNGNLSKIEYFRPKSINGIKSIEISNNNEILHYYSLKNFQKRSFENSVIINNNGLNYEYCKRDKKRNCIENRVLKINSFKIFVDDLLE